MKRVLIACAMMEDEIKKVYKELSCEIPVIWLERGYHNEPEKLKEKLQSVINEHQDADEILLGFGLCGNGTKGLVSPNTVLVIPKFDDCINLMLYTGKRKERGLACPGCLYLTHGWTQDSQAIISQYERYMEDYDEETAADLMDMMYGHYEKIALIDTGSYDPAPVAEYARKAAQLLNLSTETVDGSTEILKQLLTGQRNENFIVLNPGKPVDGSSFNV